MLKCMSDKCPHVCQNLCQIDSYIHIQCIYIVYIYILYVHILSVCGDHSKKLSMIHHGGCAQSGHARTADEPVMKATKSEAATKGKAEIVTLIYMERRVS